MLKAGHNLTRAINNLVGRMLGYEKCAFCGDRSNWKTWIDAIIFNPEDNKGIEYELPLCEGCFSSQPLIEIINAVKKDIMDDNNFCQSFGAAPAYSDADQELIMSGVKKLKTGYDGA